jgi:hypothetical protein
MDTARPALRTRPECVATMDPGVRRDDKGEGAPPPKKKKPVIPAKAGIQTGRHRASIGDGMGYGFPPSRE